MLEELLANALGGLAVEAAKEVRSIAGERLMSSDAQPELPDPLLSVLAEFSNKTTVAELDAIAGFARTTEAKTLLTQYALAAIRGRREQYRPLELQCAAYLRLYGGMSNTRASGLGIQISRIFATIAEDFAARLRSEDSRDVFEKLATSRRSNLSDLCLSEAATLLSSMEPSNLAAILRFEQLYASSLAAVTSRILPPSWTERRYVPIDDIYVPPRIRTQVGEEVNFADFLMQAPRAVMLGDPGGGKSTLVTKITNELANRVSEARSIVPFRIILRDYLKWVDQTGGSLSQFLLHEVRRVLQDEPPRLAIEYLLMSGRALVLLDGIDELIGLAQRID